MQNVWDLQNIAIPTKQETKKNKKKVKIKQT